MVRMGGPGRSKETFDELARKIEGVWEDVVVKENGGGDGQEGRKLYIVAFTPIVAALENGVVIPGVSIFIPSFSCIWGKICMLMMITIGW
jgi:hypothetical protein